MANRINIDSLGAFGIITGVLSLGYAAWQSYKLNKIANKMDMTLDEVDKKSNIDIEQDVIDTAVERAVQRKVNKATVDTMNAVKADMHQTISSQVQKEVDNQYKTLSDEVAEEISKQVAAISEDALSNKVLPRVEEKLVKEGKSMIANVRSTLTSQIGSDIDFTRSLSNVIKSFGNGGNNSNGRNINLNL